RDLTAIANVQRLEPMQRLFDGYGVRPAYMVDYAVSSQPDGYAPLRDILADARCEIGVHLQPWETPPFEGPLDEINSYLGNLPVRLQREKLVRLTGTVEQAFGIRPVLYKAGRYGVGPATASLLEELDYRIDLSVLPGTDLRHRHGPDFSRCPNR